jgi:hypothetical protein
MSCAVSILLGASSRRLTVDCERQRRGLRAYSVDYQRVVLVMASAIPIPGRRQRGSMLLVHAYVTDFVVLVVDMITWCGCCRS